MPEAWTVLMCPLCVTPVDAEVLDDWTWRSFTCTGCETEFKVKIDPDKVKTHGHAG